MTIGERIIDVDVFGALPGGKGRLIREAAGIQRGLILKDYGQSALQVADELLTAFALTPGEDREITQRLAGRVAEGHIVIDESQVVPTFAYTDTESRRLKPLVYAYNQAQHPGRWNEIYKYYYDRGGKHVDLLFDPVARLVMSAASQVHDHQGKGPTYKRHAEWHVHDTLRNHLIRAMVDTHEHIENTKRHQAAIERLTR